MAFEREAHLDHPEPEDDGVDGTEHTEDECGQVADRGERVGAGVAGEALCRRDRDALLAGAH